MSEWEWGPNDATYAEMEAMNLIAAKMRESAAAAAVIKAAGDQVTLDQVLALAKLNAETNDAFRAPAWLDYVRKARVLIPTGLLHRMAGVCSTWSDEDGELLAIIEAELLSREGGA